MERSNWRDHGNPFWNERQTGISWIQSGLTRVHLHCASSASEGGVTARPGDTGSSSPEAAACKAVCGREARAVCALRHYLQINAQELFIILFQ